VAGLAWPADAICAFSSLKHYNPVSAAPSRFAGCPGRECVRLRIGEPLVSASGAPILTGLSEAELGYLAPRLHARSFNHGDVLLVKGSLADGLS
jgi:hypothetical protein